MATDTATAEVLREDRRQAEDATNVPAVVVSPRAPGVADTDAVAPGPLPAPPPRSDLSLLADDIAGRRQENLRAQVGMAQDRAATVGPMIQEAADASETFGRMIAQNPPPAPPTLPAPPSRRLHEFLAPTKDESPENAIAKFIQAMGLFAIGFTGGIKGDARASLAALSGAMQGWVEGDIARADRAFADWKASTESMLTQYDALRQGWRDWASAANLSLEQKVKGIQLLNLKAGIEMAPLELEAKGLDALMDDITKRDAAAEKTRQFYLALLEKREEGQRNRDAAEERARIAADARLQGAEIMNAWRQQQAAEKLERDREIVAEFGPEAVDIAAAKYIDEGRMPAIGLGGKAAMEVRAKIMNRVGEMLREMGETPQGLAMRQRTIWALQTEANRLLAQRGPVLAFARTADHNLKIAEELSAKVPRSEMPALNKWLLAGEQQWRGNPEVAAFATATREALNEAAKVISGGNVVSDTARREVESVLNINMTPAQFRESIKILRANMDKRIKGYDEQLAQIQSQMATMTGAPAAGGAPAPKPAEDGGRIRVKGPDGQTGTALKGKPLPPGWEEVK